MRLAPARTIKHCTRGHRGRHGAKDEHLQDRSRSHPVAERRARGLSRWRARRRRDHASGVPERGAIGRLALRFSGPSGEPRADDVRARRRQPPHQPLLADAARLRPDGAAPQSHAGLGGRLLWVPGPLVGQRMGIEVFRRHGEDRAKALAGYFDYISRNDLYLTYVIVNPQADRSKDWGDQVPDLVARIVDEDAAGITLRGAKMLGTSAILANEVFVANLQPLKAGEEALAFSCALPMNAKGLRVLSRKSYEAAAKSVYDNPLSSRFDENDALIYFDEVKVPWDRVFVHRDVDMCRAQFHDTACHVYQNYQAQVRLSVKIKFLIGLARRITESIGTINIPAVREQLGYLAAHAGMVNAMLVGMEAAGHKWGEYYLPNRHYMYSAQVLTQELYPQLMNLLRELAGGALIMLPSSVLDFANPELKAIIEKTQRSPSMSPERKVKFLKAAWDAIGSEFGSRHTQYEMFYAGARFVTAGHSFRTFDWDGATGMVEQLLSSYDLAGALEAERR